MTAPDVPLMFTRAEILAEVARQERELHLEERPPAAR